MKFQNLFFLKLELPTNFLLNLKRGGGGNGFEYNIVYLFEKKGWTGLMMDYGADQDIQWKGVLKKVQSNKND